LLPGPRGQLIDIPLDPNVHLGPITLAWHGIFTAVGIFFGVWLPVRLLRPYVSEDAAYGVATIAVISGILGARLVHVIDCWTACGYDRDPLLIPQIWSGGIAIWGAAIFGTLGGFVAAVRRGLPIGKGADAGAPGMGLGFAIGRIGDVINGEHHAIPCDGAPGICVTYSNPDTLGQGPQFTDSRFSPGPVHLVVGYDLVWDALSVVVALWLRRFIGRWPDGLIFWIWAVQYAIGRLLLGFLRTNPQFEPAYAFGLRQDQIIGLLVIAAAIPMLVRLGTRGWAKGGPRGAESPGPA